MKLRSRGSVDWLGGGVCGGWPPLPCAHVAAARPKQADTNKTIVVIRHVLIRQVLIRHVVIRQCKRRTSITSLSCCGLWRSPTAFLSIPNTVLGKPNGLSERSDAGEMIVEEVFGIVKGKRRRRRFWCGETRRRSRCHRSLTPFPLDNWEHEGNRAMVDGRWKLVSRFPDRWELYDLQGDRCEMRDLAGSEFVACRAHGGPL